MPLQQLGEYTKLISSLDDIPIMSAADLKAYFDSAPEEIRDAYNKAIAVLLSVTDGDSGADNIGATKIKDVDGETVQTILESLKVLIDKKIGTTDVFTKKELESTTEGSSGASKIKTSAISGLTGDNVQTFLKALKDTVDQLALNQIPDGSITLDKLNDNIKDLFNKIGLVNKDVAQLMLNTDAKDRVTKGGTFGTSFDTTFGMEIDTFKSYSESPLEIGATEITLVSVVGLKVGKEVTIFDDVNLERRVVNAINGNVISVDALTKSYKAYVNVSRTTSIIDATNKALKFGGWNTKEALNFTDTTVVASKFTTEGNGKKIVRLENGWIVCGVHDALGDIPNIKFYALKPEKGTFEYIGYKSLSLQGFSLASKGNTVYFLSPLSTRDKVVLGWFDATTINQEEITNSLSIDTGLTDINGTYLEIDPITGVFHAAWTCKDANQPNSFNLRYSKSSDGTVWSAKEKITSVTPAGFDCLNPSLKIGKSRQPIIIYEFKNTNAPAYGIGCCYFLGGQWINDAFKITREDTAVQQSPKSFTDANGHLHVVWYGGDSVNPTDNIKYSKSTDDAVSFSTPQKLTNDSKPQRNPAITGTQSGELFVIWSGISVASVDALGLRKMQYTQGVWSGIEEIKSDKGYNNNYPQALIDLNLDILSPLFIYSNAKDQKVGFYGTWNNPIVKSVLENDVRFTTNDTSQVAAWIDHDYGLSIDGFWNNTNMESSTKDITTQSQETQIQSDIKEKQASEVKLTLTRDLITDDLKITRILGGVD